MKKFLLPVFLLIANIATAQLDTSKSNLSFTGYTEVYYAYDLNQPIDHNRPSFFYSHNHHNEFNLNLGYVKAAYSTDRVHANIAFGTGTYMHANYATEPDVLKNIYEANAGVKLFQKKNVWFDAGIFASHIGFESAVSKDCWSLSRSILAENTPFYESGIKISYSSDNSKWFLSGLILNGWQHIQRLDNNNTLSYGTQVSFTPNAKITLNYSTFIGNEKPDTAKQMRYFHNFYGIFHLSDKIHLAAGFDYGMEQKSLLSKEYNNWYSPVLIVKVNLSDKWSVTARGEYYSDENGVIITLPIVSGTPTKFQTSGYSLNFDCRIRENAVWRIEGRTLGSSNKIFIKGGNPVKSNTFVTTSLAISF